MSIYDFDNFHKKCTRWKEFYWIAGEISIWYSFKKHCGRVGLMRNPLLLKCVRCLNKFAAMSRVAEKSVMLINDFVNIREKCTRWKDVYWIAGDNSITHLFKNHRGLVYIIRNRCFHCNVVVHGYIVIIWTSKLQNYVRVCILSWDSIEINIGCIFSVFVAHFLPFSFGVFFAKRESGG